jgi:hypothetical protein
MTDSKIHRCKCGEWLYADQECIVCDIIEKTQSRKKVTK